MENQNALLRQLPQVNEVLAGLVSETEGIPAAIVKKAVQEQIDRCRNAILAGEKNSVSREEIISGVRLQLERDSRFHLKGVINATGVVLHTNLGRARLPEGAMELISEIAVGYSNLEYDLDTGERGSRYEHVESLLTQLTGAEAALVVNNNAAAVLLTLDTMVKGKDVIVSRGELVEIGGSFRIPAVMERSGCRMVEVGTTNKTHPDDYAGQITEQTGALLKVHTSNYKIIGFSEAVSIEELWKIGSANHIPVIYDLGSGLLTRLDCRGVSTEPTVAECAAYSDVLCFSGDKLLGGPQAGIIVGRKAAIAGMKKNHLLRALRIDKLTLAALEYTLRQYLEPEKAIENIPTLRMITASGQESENKAAMLASLLRPVCGVRYETVKTVSQIGGGSLPGVELPSAALSVSSDEYPACRLERMLRENQPPVIARVSRERLLLDMRTVDYHEIPAVADCFNKIFNA